MNKLHTAGYTVPSDYRSLFYLSGVGQNIPFLYLQKLKSYIFNIYIYSSNAPIQGIKYTILKYFLHGELSLRTSVPCILPVSALIYFVFISEVGFSFFTLLIGLVYPSLCIYFRSLLTSYTGYYSRYSPDISMINASNPLFKLVVCSSNSPYPPHLTIAPVGVHLKRISCRSVPPSISS